MGEARPGKAGQSPHACMIATLIEHATIPTRGPLWRVSLRQILIAILARNQLSLTGHVYDSNIATEELLTN